MTVSPLLLATDAANALTDARAALDAAAMAAKPCSFPGPAPSDLAFYAMAIVDSAGAVDAAATFARRCRAQRGSDVPVLWLADEPPARTAAWPARTHSV